MDTSRRTVPMLGLAALAGALATAPASAAGSASSWETIRRTRTLRLGVTPSEPWYAKDLATGSGSALACRSRSTMAKDMDGSKVAFVETTWANAPAGLQANQFDVMFVLDPTPARALAIDFPFAPVLYYALGYMTKEASHAASWAALDRPDMTIAVPVGTAMDRWITVHLPKASIVRLPTIDQTILYYQSGKGARAGAVRSGAARLSDQDGGGAGGGAEAGGDCGRRRRCAAGCGQDVARLPDHRAYLLL